MVLGKLFGGTFGFMVGGPIGALLGAAVGHNFDQQVRNPSITSKGFNEHSHVQALFLQTAFQLMGHIAKADGRVSELEIATARAIMERLGLDASQRHTAIECFTAGKQPDFAIATAFETFQQISSNRPNLLQQLLEMQLNIAYADGKLHPRTHAQLLFTAAGVGVSRLQFEALHSLFRGQHHWSKKQQHNDSRSANSDQSGQRRSYGSRPTAGVNSIGQAYAILGLSQDANISEIKLAYRRLLKKHHPDKLAANNVSPTEIKKATEKTRELTAAYERIREARNF